MDDEIFEQDIKQYFEPDETYNQIDEKELIKKLEDSASLEELSKLPAWKAFNEAWRRLYKTAEIQLDNIDPNNTARIIEAQLTKRFYRDVLGTTIKKIREDGKSAFEQAKDRGMLDRLFAFMKKNF